MGKKIYVIYSLEFFYVEIIILPVIFDGQTPLGLLQGCMRSALRESLGKRKDTPGRFWVWESVMIKTQKNTIVK